jgi:tetratricopeptide (TPR) repeat protein
MRVVHATCVLCLIAAGVTPATATAGDTSWAGKDIILKKTGIRIRYTDDNGKQVYVAKLTAIQYVALADQNGWLKVRSGKETGWFDKNDAVLAEDANAYFSALLAREPNNAQYYARRGWAWYALGENTRAVADYTQAIRVNPNESDWFMNRGIIYRTLRDYDASVRDFTRALQLAPNAAYLYNNRAWSYGLKKDFDRAFADFDTALRLEPENSYTYNRRGIVYVTAKDYDRALQDYEEVIRLNPDYMWAYNNRAIAWHRKGDYAKAIADFEKAIKMDADEPGPQSGLAWLLATCPDLKFRDGKRALALAKQACARSRYKSPIYLGTLSAAYADNGQFDEAVKWQRKALEDPGYAREETAEAEERLKLYAEKKPYTLALSGDEPTVPVPERKEVVKTPAAAAIATGPLKGWKEFKSAEGGFGVAFPETPKHHKQRIASPVGNVDNFAFSHEGVEMTHLVGYFDLPQDGILTLDKAAAAYAAGRKATLVSQKAATVSGMTGREIVAQLPDKNLSRVRIVIVGQRWYQVIAEGPADLVNSDRTTSYLDSFKLAR